MVGENRDLANALEGVDALLPTGVYEALYETVAREKPARVLEIGTAHGGGTIAIALGAKSAGVACRIQTVDTLQSMPDIPSSRNKWGTVDENEAIVRGNFESAGVAGFIDLFVGRSDQFAGAKLLSHPIDMLVLDADGRIDRDLLLFGQHLSDNAIVVIDDVGGGLKMSVVGAQKYIDLKHVISERLMDGLTKHGFLRIERAHGVTMFCRAIAPQNWDRALLGKIALEAYRDLVFVEIGNREIWEKFGRSALKNSPLGRLLWPLVKLPVRMIYRAR